MSVYQVQAATLHHGTNPILLNLDLTESIFLTDINQAIASLRAVVIPFLERLRFRLFSK
ncbi:hypothetical protein MGMO_3c00010 [Methyloglobulus morosus KoM1]|uniref:Uncharacterized protein n=1 Tax=Methyloglobulus morosus KoM1 TaxID=1116472 RepID=V5C213_9GAMM|nr:hypothetical protein MGMO_3c00010 [Methyloglobulus morosus KoM1]